MSSGGALALAFLAVESYMQQTHKSALKNFLYCSLPLHITFGGVKKTGFYIIGVWLFTFVPLQDLLVKPKIVQSNENN